MRRTPCRTTPCRGTRPALFLLAALAALGPVPSVGQAGDTARAAEAALRLYNEPATTRVNGAAHLAADSELAGDVAVLGGPLTLAGTVRGSVAVINGDLVLEPGARVLGNVVVAGGRVLGVDGATLEGTVSQVPEPVEFRREGERLVLQAPRRGSPLTTGRRFSFGSTELTLGVRGSYNRVEGLPVAAGPRVELGRSNPTVLDGRLVYRTRSGLGFRPNELGYVVRVEQYLGGHRTLRLGATLRSEIQPIQATSLSDLESSLATFVLHRAYRDHYERHGWSAYLAFRSRSRPWELVLEYLDENHSSEAPREPWSLRYNDEPWRPQPLVAEGELRSVTASFTLDTRNDRREPSAGWLLNLQAEQGVGGLQTLLAPSGLPGSPLIPTGVDEEFTAFHLDARRYVRISPRERLAVRILAGGSVDGRHLPPQRQQVLGGEGLMPGYPVFHFDCGARTLTLATNEGSFYPAYGCDRAALVQLQYSMAFAIVPGIGRRLGLDLDFGDSAELVLFVDVGRAWSEDPTPLRNTGRNQLDADAGIGFALGHLGIYGATALTGGGKGVNVFLRLSPRI